MFDGCAMLKFKYVRCCHLLADIFVKGGLLSSRQMGFFSLVPHFFQWFQLGLKIGFCLAIQKSFFSEKRKKKHYYGRKFPICRTARFQSSFPQYRDRQRPMKGDCFFLCMQLKDLMPDWFPIIQFTLNNLEWTGRDIGIVFVDLFVSLPASMLSLSILRPKRSSRNSFWTSRGRARRRSLQLSRKCPKHLKWMAWYMLRSIALKRGSSPSVPKANTFAISVFKLTIFEKK